MKITIGVNTIDENNDTGLAAEQLIAKRIKECLEECFPPDTGILVEVSSITKEVVTTTQQELLEFDPVEQGA